MKVTNRSYLFAIILICLFLNSSCIAQIENKNTSLNAEFGFSDEVKRAVIREIWKYSHDSSDFVKEEVKYQFNKTGDTVLYYFYRSSGTTDMEYRYIYNYSKGKRISYICYDLGYDWFGERFENIDYKTICLYTSNGKLIEERSFKPDTKNKDEFIHNSSTYFKYNIKGQLRKEKHKAFNVNPLSKEQMLGINYDYTTTYKYDKRGNLIIKFEKRPLPFHYDSERILYNYNKDNQLIYEYTDYKRRGGDDQHIDSNYYDSKGNLVKTVYYSKKYDYRKRIIEYTYDTNKRIATEIWHYIDKDLINLNDIRKITYEYDKFGNIQRKKELYVLGYGTIPKEELDIENYEYDINIDYVYEYEYW